MTAERPQPRVSDPGLSDPGLIDRQLVRDLLAGREEAYDRLFREQVPVVFRIVVSWVGHDHDLAEEVVQAALIRAIGKLSTFRGEASLVTWLATFCRRELSRRRRKLHLEPVPFEDSPGLRAALELIDQSVADPELRAQRGELRNLVRATLDRLPTRYADLLEWKYLHGLSVEEIASRVGDGKVAVQSALARARGSFRDAFETVSAACAGRTTNQLVDHLTSTDLTKTPAKGDA